MESKLLFVLLIFSMACSLTHGNGYILSRFGHMYKLVTTPNTWENAKLTCEKEGGRLAMPKTKEQFDYLVEKIAATATTQFWIGVQYVKEENKVKGKDSFKYVDGEKYALGLWEEDEPATAEDQACIVIKIKEVYDRSCTDTRAYICEADLACDNKLAPSYTQVAIQQSWEKVSCGTSQGIFNEKAYKCVTDAIPLYVWVEVPVDKLFLPGVLSFEVDSDNLFYPVDYQFIGSNDETCSTTGNWVVLGEVNHNNYKDAELQPFERSYCKASLENITPFRCLGMLVKNANGWSAIVKGQIAFKNVRLWSRSC